MEVYRNEENNLPSHQVVVVILQNIKDHITNGSILKLSFLNKQKCWTVYSITVIILETRYACFTPTILLEMTVAVHSHHFNNGIICRTKDYDC